MVVKLERLLLCPRRCALQVNYEENVWSSLVAFREGRRCDFGAAARLIDRPIQPMFQEGFRNEAQDQHGPFLWWVHSYLWQPCLVHPWHFHLDIPFTTNRWVRRDQIIINLLLQNSRVESLLELLQHNNKQPCQHGWVWCQRMLEALLKAIFS